MTIHLPLGCRKVSSITVSSLALGLLARRSIVTMFSSTAVFFLSASGLMANVQASSAYYPQNCDNINCGPGSVCQMVDPPYCPYESSCSIPQCRPPTSCDDLECDAGYVCQVDDPPGNCPHCQPRAFCKPESQGYCGTGEAYDFQKGECVPFTCESPDVSHFISSRMSPSTVCLLCEVTHFSPRMFS